MDSPRTVPKPCSKKSCKNLIPPPDSGSKDYSTCSSCRARDAASKDRSKRKRNASQAALTHAPRINQQPSSRFGTVPYMNSNTGTSFRPWYRGVVVKSTCEEANLHAVHLYHQLHYYSCQYLNTLSDIILTVVALQ